MIYWKFSTDCTWGRSMKGIASRQIQDYNNQSALGFNPKVKCVTVAIYEKEGKTILQPLVNEHDAGIIPEMFQNQTLEVWLSNGKSDVSLFDVTILKYKQVNQEAKKCSRIKDQVCLKNQFEDIVHCEQCPLDKETDEDKRGEGDCFEKQKWKSD